MYPNDSREKRDWDGGNRSACGAVSGMKRTSRVTGKYEWYLIEWELYGFEWGYPLELKNIMSGVEKMD